MDPRPSMKSDTPQNLYKYLPASRTAEVLKSLRIRFSQVSVLNDALEFKPPVKGLAERSRLEGLLKERLRTTHPELMELVDQLLPAGTVDQVILAGAEQASAIEHALRTAQLIYQKLDENMGILSLSETPTDTLLWSLYADGGRGFLIEFDPKHAWFWNKRSENDE